MPHWHGTWAVNGALPEATAWHALPLCHACRALPRSPNQLVSNAVQSRTATLSIPCTGNSGDLLIRVTGTSSQSSALLTTSTTVTRRTTCGACACCAPAHNITPMAEHAAVRRPPTRCVAWAAVAGTCCLP